MTGRIVVADREDWEVPVFDTLYWNGSSHPWIVVIPVLNEGERIIRLLERMRSSQICNKADILVVDGGSTDGSIQIARMQSYHVCSALS